MKRQIFIPIIISLLLVGAGVLSIFLWKQSILSIHGLVLGIMAIILSWFVFHFSRK